jgi:hypothetical protein
VDYGSTVKGTRWIFLGETRTYAHFLNESMHYCNIPDKSMGIERKPKVISEQRGCGGWKSADKPGSVVGSHSSGPAVADGF